MLFLLVLPLGSTCLRKFFVVVFINRTYLHHEITKRYESSSVFSERIALSLPDASQRAIALEYHLASSSSSFDKNTIKEKARSCHAFVLRDMAFVAEEAKRGKSLTISHVKSSLLSASFSVSVPNVSWNHVGGVNEAKRALEEAVIWPSTRSEDLHRMGVKPPRGILLVGPPGVGKTLLAKAVATASRSHFLTASVSSLVDAASGESAAKIRNLFSIARQCAPSVVFLDEFQALFGTRDGGSSHSRQLISQLLMEFDQCRYDDGNSKRVFVLAATNVRWCSSVVNLLIESTHAHSIPGTKCDRSCIFHTWSVRSCLEIESSEPSRSCRYFKRSQTTVFRALACEYRRSRKTYEWIFWC